MKQKARRALTLPPSTYKVKFKTFKANKQTYLCLHCQMESTLFEGQQVTILVTGSLWKYPQTNL